MIIIIINNNNNYNDNISAADDVTVCSSAGPDEDASWRDTVITVHPEHEGTFQPSSGRYTQQHPQEN